jgi:TonB family protein
MKNRYTTSLFLSLTLAVMGSLAIAQETDLHVMPNDALEAATSKVQPAYPPIAKQLGLKGEVEVETHIDENGAVESAKVKTGNALLGNAALEAAKHWKFKPFTANGKPVKAVTEITFNFKI